MDNNGNILWTQAFGTNEEDDWGWTVFEKNIGEIIMIGSTKSFNASLFDIFMLSMIIDDGKKLKWIKKKISAENIILEVMRHFGFRRNYQVAKYFDVTPQTLSGLDKKW